MTNFKLMKVGQAISVNEFTGEAILQNGHYLQIVGAGNDIVASLNLEPGYYLANRATLSSNSDLSTAPGGASSADIQGDAERQNHMAMTDSQTLQGLRREESLAEQQGGQASNIAAPLKNLPQYDARQNLSTAPGGASSADIPGDAERENHMAVTDSQTLQRLRREESLAEQHGRQALNIAAILKDHPQYDAARQKADTLLAKASALREKIVKIETF